METWKLFHKSNASNGRPVTKNYKRLWFVSDHGNIKIVNSWNNKEKFPTLAETGGHKSSGRYLALTVNDAPDKYVHRIVANAFLPNLEAKPTVNHKDGNKLNNHIDNLEWSTYHENAIHGVELRRQKSQDKHDLG